MEYIEAHLTNLTSQLTHFPRQNVILFSIFCLNRQWNTLSHLPSDRYTDFCTRHLTPFIRDLRCLTLPMPVVLSGFFGIERAFLNFVETGAPDSPSHLLSYTILQSLMDTLHAIGDNEISYLTEYPAYRNLDFLSTWNDCLCDILEDNSFRQFGICSSQDLIRIECSLQWKECLFLSSRPSKEALLTFFRRSSAGSLLRPLPSALP